MEQARRAPRRRGNRLIPPTAQGEGPILSGFETALDWTVVAPRGNYHWRMPMRTECKNFESRSYPNGDTVRKCNIDLAPDAPWRCPENCTGYERRLADAAWTHGTLVVPPTPPEPAGLDDGSAAAVLDAAEDILNSVGADVKAEVEAEREAAQKAGIFKRLFGRKR